MVHSPTVIDHDLDGMFVREVSPAASGGTGHPLVFIHGGFHGWWTWERWQPYFADLGWRTYALSLPGHAGSTPLSQSEFVSLGLADYADAVRGILAWLGEPAVLIGHSMGGIVARMVAERTDPTALVLVASGRAREGEKFRPDVPLGEPIRIEREEARKRFFHVIADEEFDRVFQRLGPESPIALNDVTRSGAVSSTRFDCPVVVLTAEHDRDHVRELADHAAITYRATRAVVRNAGHDLMLDPNWCSAAAYLHAWLVTHAPTGLPAVRVEARD